MHKIEWRNWRFEDFCILADPEPVHKSLTKNKAALKSVLDEELFFLISILILENQDEKLIETDSTLLPGFEQTELLKFKNKEDIEKSNNGNLKRMLNKIEENMLILPAPLCKEQHNKLFLVDGSHRSAFAKILNIPIKVQVLKTTSMWSRIIEAHTKHQKLRKLMLEIKTKFNNT